MTGRPALRARLPGRLQQAAVGKPDQDRAGGLALSRGAAEPAFFFLLAVLPLAALAAGAAAARRGRTGTEGRGGVLISAVVASLALFAVLAAHALITARGPYDPSQVRDFHGSGMPSLAAYAVGDNLGTAMALMLLTFIMTAALGCTAATVAAGVLRTTPARQPAASRR